MESLTRANNQSRLVEIDQTLSNLQEMNLVDFLNTTLHRKHLMELLDVNLLAFRVLDEEGNEQIYTHFDDDGNNHVEVSPDAFHCLCDTYGQVCKDYGVVFIDETRNNPALGTLHTLAFFQFPGVTPLDMLLSRKAVVELVQWGGDPEKVLQPDGRLSPRNSFASFVKGHLKRGKPWDEADKELVKRFAERIERYKSTEVVKKQNEALQHLGQERNDLIKDQKENLDFFAFMAHELRTPFHGVLGSLEAMKEDPVLANNQLLNQALMCGNNMIRILDDILLVAKGSYSLNIKEEAVDVTDFLHQTVLDMTNFAYMEGVSVRIRKEDVTHRILRSDFNRVRQVVHNLISNAIKFSEDDIYVEMLQRRSFSEVLTVWKTYTASYPNHEPRLRDVPPVQPTTGGDDDDNFWMIFSVIDKGIGIKAPDLKKLGTAFTQLSQGRQKKYQGELLFYLVILGRGGLLGLHLWLDLGLFSFHSSC
jgi:signal transduction histidine kinase